MKSSRLVHISLGSNIDNRTAYIQDAVDKIYIQIGDVVGISAIYQTTAWGFEGDDFYNACIAVRTFLSPPEVLNLLLEIEKKLGRKRSDDKQYQSRTIDLDMIIFSDEVVQTDSLVIPHPRMQDRKFVLQPLSEIAAETMHPLYNKTVKQLLENTSDTTSSVVITQQTLENPKKKYTLSDFQYLVIEGNIGAGKTSLVKMMASEFNAKPILERFADNPFLPKFYKNMDRYAFPLEMSFLADRYQILQDDIAQFDLFKDFVISDYDVFKSLIFAKITLSPEEFLLYKKVFDLMNSNLVKPGLYIYLYQNTERLLENIKKRGRGYEQDIAPDYLEKINKGYLHYIKSQPELNIKIIDVSNLDFIRNREDYITILKKISE